MGREVNLEPLVIGLERMRKSAAGDAYRIMQAVKFLRDTSLPEAYVDGIQDELLQMLCQPVPKDLHIHVYLAFHGTEGRASFMKIGVAKNVKSRMSSLATGNPMPRIWTYATPLSCRQKAHKVESALLSHMAGSRVNGEWVNVHGLSEEAALGVVGSLAEVAGAVVREPIEFRRIEG